MASEQGSKLPKVDKATSFPWDADAASISAFEERSKTIFVNPTRKQPGWIDVFGVCDQLLPISMTEVQRELTTNLAPKFGPWLLVCR